MKTFFLTLAIFFICLLQGLMGNKANLKSESKETNTEQHGCGHHGFYPCKRGYYWNHGVRYYGYPLGYGYRGCRRNCYRNGYCC